MNTQNMARNKDKPSSSNSKDLVYYVTLLGISPLLVFVITKEHYFFSDDYLFFFGIQLYNLIQDSLLSFENIFAWWHIHFFPFNIFLNQFLPLDAIKFHALVILFFFISNIIVYFIFNELTENKKLSLLGATIYSVNYSIHFKSLYWATFYYNIANSLTGFLSILILIFILKKEKYTFLNFFTYIILSLITVSNYETGLVYPIISILIIVLFFKKQIIYCLFPIFFLLFFVISVAFITGDFLPLLKSRTSSDFSEKYAQTIQLNDNNYLHYYRSNYAPRDKLGYGLRIIDNLAATANLTSLEESIKYYFNKEKLKKNYLNNFKLIFLGIMILLTIFLFYIFKNIKDFTYKRHLILFSVLYLCLFTIYTIIFFRRDLNIALAFPSSIILAIIIFEFYKLKKKFFYLSIAVLYLLPSIIYASTGFEYTGDFKRSNVNKAGYEYYINAKKKNKNVDYEGYKYYYYYTNYEDNMKYLEKYKNISLQKFFETLTME